MKPSVYFLFIYLVQGILSAGITLTEYPSETVERGSVQTLAWKTPSNVTLQSVRVDLYQSNQLKKTLSTTNTDARTFQWQVSQNAKLGEGYLIRVTGVSTQGKTAWANTPYFSITIPIIHSVSAAGWLVLISVILVIVGGCMFCHNRKRHDNSYYYRADTPQALPIHCNPPPAVNPVYNPSATVCYPATSTRSGYSGGTVAGAALAGAVGGALFENAVLPHHSGHSGSNDFGGGMFGLTSDGGGGATGGDF